MIGRGMLRIVPGRVRSAACVGSEAARPATRSTRAAPRGSGARVAVPGRARARRRARLPGLPAALGRERLRGPGRVRRRRAGARRRRDPRRPGSRARPARLQRVRVRLRAAQLGADVRRLSGREAVPLPRRRRHGLRERELGRRPVLLPGRPAGLPRPHLLRRHGGAARGAGRLRVGVRDRARGRPPRAEPARHERRGAAPAARAIPTRPTRCRCGSSCRPTATRASGRAPCSTSSTRAIVKEAIRASEAVGDDRLQRRATGEVRPDSFTHGTSEQRAKWFRTGQSSGQPADCDTFSRADESQPGASARRGAVSPRPSAMLDDGASLP